MIMLLTTTAVFAYTTSSKIVFEDDFSAYAENSRVAYHPGGKGINSNMAICTYRKSVTTKVSTRKVPTRNA